MNSIRLFFLHRNKLLAEVFHRVARQRGGMTVVRSSDDLEDAVRAIRDLSVDLVLIEPWLDPEPARPGIRRLKSLHPDVKVLPIGLETDEEILGCLEAGASGYLPEDAGIDETLATIRAIHDGRARSSAVLTSRVLRRIDQLSQQVRPAPASPSRPALTRREREVLRLLVDGRSNKQIAEALDIALATTKVHVHRIFRKLDVSGRREAVDRVLALRLLDD